MKRKLYIQVHLIHDEALRDRILRTILASPLPHGEESPTIGTVVMWLESSRQACEEMQAALMEMGLPPSLCKVKMAALPGPGRDPEWPTEQRLERRGRPPDRRLPPARSGAGR